MTATRADVGALVDRATIRRLVSGVRATAGRTAPTASPLDGSRLADVPQSSEADVEGAFAGARAAQPAWSAWPVGRRADVLLVLAERGHGGFEILRHHRLHLVAVHADQFAQEGARFFAQLAQPDRPFESFSQPVASAAFSSSVSGAMSAAASAALSSARFTAFAFSAFVCFSGLASDE